MRTIAIICFGIGSFFLLRRLDFAFQIIPLHAPGVEGGMIEVAIDTICGGIAALVALLLSIVHFLRYQRSKFARTLLIGCCSLVAGLVLSLFL